VDIAERGTWKVNVAVRGIWKVIMKVTSPARGSTRAAPTAQLHAGDILRGLQTIGGAAPAILDACT